MTSSFLLHQLYILRSQMELVIAAAESLEPAPAPQEGCEHPEEKRKDVSHLGGERQYMCLVCGETVKGIA